MTITYLKKSPKTSSTDDTKTTGIVQDLLKNIETTKEQGCVDLTKKFDNYDGDIIVSKDRIEETKKTLDQKTKDDIQFSFDRVKKFAEAQLKNYGKDFEVELSDGLYAGQKLVPVNTAGCYIPGGRYYFKFRWCTCNCSYDQWIIQKSSCRYYCWTRKPICSRS